MRPSLLYNPRVLIERLAIASQRRRRREPLRGTPAERLALGHLDSLELLQMISPAPTVIYDIGANVGTWTCLAKSLFPKAQVEAFEPLSVHGAQFSDWTRSWSPEIRLHSVALGSETGVSEMIVTNVTDASSLLPLTDTARTEFKIDESRREQVKVAALDSLLSDGRIVPPDLIKLDVQGYELHVLRGGTRCLQTARWVLAEVSFKRFYAGQPLFHEIAAFLSDHNFHVHAFGASLPTGAPASQADVLFKRG